MELTSHMKMTRFQTFWIQMRKNKPLDEIRKTGQTSGTKTAFYSSVFVIKPPILFVTCMKDFRKGVATPTFVPSSISILRESSSWVYFLQGFLEETSSIDVDIGGLLVPFADNTGALHTKMQD
ncbi:hypothetical protein Hanom_Chr11g01049411 [Helianthus anomalus]